MHRWCGIVDLRLAGGDRVGGDIEDRQVLGRRHRPAVAGADFVEDGIDAGRQVQVPECSHPGPGQIEDLPHLLGNRVGQTGDLQRRLQGKPGGLCEHRGRLEALMDQQVRARGRLHHMLAGARVSGEDNFEPGIGDGVADRAAEPVDRREAGDGHAVALVDRLRVIVGDLVPGHRKTGGRADAADRGGIQKGGQARSAHRYPVRCGRG